jgi:hypothetical protein
MNVLAIGRYTGEDIQPHIPAEKRRVAELRKEGFIRDLFFKADRSGPVLILSNTDRADAEARLATLPFVEKDLLSFELVELD